MQILIKHAIHPDIKAVYDIERSIEKDYAASVETLKKRLDMYSQGFYVAVKDNKIIAYMETCLWNKEHFVHFNEISDFPLHHDPNGKYLYLIYIAVDKYYRRFSIGSQLIATLKQHALQHNLKKIQLVAAEGFLLDFYNKMGFTSIATLPEFLPGVCGTLMEYYCSPVEKE